MEHKTVDKWLDELADRTPTPGGGAAAALSAATAAALIGMVTSYTTGAKWADREARMQEIQAEVTQLRKSFLELADQDADAFAALQAAYKSAANSETEKIERTNNIQNALAAAAEPPRQTAALTRKLVAICSELRSKANPNIASDVAVAASAAKSALESAIINMEINNKHIKDRSMRDKIFNAVKETEQSIDEAQNVITTIRKSLV